MKHWKVVYPVSLIIIFYCVWWCLWPCWWGQTTTVLLVRHAEKASFPAEDPPLTPEGEARAAKLAHVAGNAGVTTIFATNTLRTVRTAHDIATLLGLTPLTPGGTPQELADLILADHRGNTVLVVGHSNTVPDIIEALGGETMPSIPEGKFDRFFIVTVPQWCGGTSVVKLRYGEVSP